MSRSAPHLHRRQRGRREEHADRAAAVRLARGLRRSGALGREGLVKNRDGRPDRLLALHRRPAGRARAGHHHRRRLPLLRHRAPQVHPRRHAGPRAVHAQHGHRRVDGRRRHPAGRRAQRRARCSPAGTRASRGCSASPTSSSRSTRWTWSTSTAAVFDDIVRRLRGRPAGADVHAIPISALHGDNVITRSERTPWFDGPTLLEFLETVEVDRDAPASRSAFPCSSCRGPTTTSAATPDRSLSGTIRPGDTITAWPSGRIDARQADRDLRRRSARWRSRRCR